MPGPRIAFVLGTRPEIIKLSPVIRACLERDVPHTVVHTGQHYSESLDKVFFDQLELPEPEYNLGVGSKPHGEQTGEMVADIAKIIRETDPDSVLVQGDTNSVLAGAIATSKLEPALGHVEAGLRSFNREMPEEINRILVDHAAEYLFAPTEESAVLLEDEGLPGEHAEVIVTGNTIVDAVQQNLELARRKSTALEEHGLKPNEYYLLTAHRAENVDDRGRFAAILSGVNELAERTDREIIYPIHPRAREHLDAFDLSVPDRVHLTEPFNFLDFLSIEHNSRLVVTDSGGVQEETCILETPCVTVRDSTERPETIAVGANRLVETEPSAIVDGAETMLACNEGWSNPFGDGSASERILDALL